MSEEGEVLWLWGPWFRAGTWISTGLGQRHRITFGFLGVFIFIYLHFPFNLVFFVFFLVRTTKKSAREHCLQCRVWVARPVFRPCVLKKKNPLVMAKTL